ncbi:outer membrane protein assembly factor BamA [Coxiella-like endosymbiont of Amblyomma americanum]|uniref:outer membrane protein assembly factor BamA n=1 Tax=Coxiella-like endosymbiont of Amblyomma americanum TaxID=1987500 RepID=UPI000F89E897|nr:outer membrane protein assembly factor BamA [Coxiella-like endosymbiont of Amblyomma americanum]AUJ58657.1 outer membrane protein assembly factor BamA [Coxiella-like endosymbiont of Amblyomma americanum]
MVRPLHKRLLFTIAFIVLWIPLNLEAHDFIVRFIRIRGLQEISESTVRHYLPISKGQKYTFRQGQFIIKKLYKTGFFDDIKISSCGKILVITVKERPTVSVIHLNNQSVITNKKLRLILYRYGIIEGQIFDPFKLEQVKQGLEQQYGVMGYYSVHISTNVVRKSSNRIELYIKVEKPKIAKVYSIRFIGNQSFKEHILYRQFKKLISTGFLDTWIGNHRANRYSQIRLEKDLENLTIFYLNHGYLRFRLISYDVRWSSDKSKVYITVHINEGPAYYVSMCEISSANGDVKNLLRRFITLKSGDTFSRKNVIRISNNIRNFLGNQGYAFAKVVIIPIINDKRHLVNIKFNIIPGKLVHVRWINFLGNQHTNQAVLRREMRQYEGSIYSLSKIEESKRRLALLDYLSEVAYTVQPVSNSIDQVDLCYHVREIASGRASIQGGYSDVYGFLYGVSVVDPNFMGSGKYIAIKFQNNQYQRNYSIIYNNPYYTVWGLQQGVSMYYSRVRPDKKFNLSPYLEDGYGIDIAYSYPVSDHNIVMFSYGIGHVAVNNVDVVNAAPSVLAFLGTINGVQNVNAMYNQVKLAVNWTYNKLDRTILPTTGLYVGSVLEVNIPIFFVPSLDYYLATYTMKYYRPLWKEMGRNNGFILNVLATVGYGNGFDRNSRLPFFKNFFSGGIGSLPAFAPNSLGPKNRYPLGRDFGAIGGNLEVIFGAHLIFPQFFSQNVRTAIVFDAGNVFQVPRFFGDIAIPARGGAFDPEANTRPQIIQDDRFSLKNLRSSLGLSLEWYTAFAPIDFTLAFPLSRRSGDHFQAFQFSLGMIL